LNIRKLVYSKWVYNNLHFAQQISILPCSRIPTILKNDVRLTCSGLGSVTGTTGRVFPLVLHPISCKFDGYEPTLKRFFSVADVSPNEKSAFKTQHLPYPFTIYPFTDVQMAQHGRMITWDRHG
jgi:hypothetical protein